MSIDPALDSGVGRHLAHSLRRWSTRLSEQNLTARDTAAVEQMMYAYALPDTDVDEQSDADRLLDETE